MTSLTLIVPGQRPSTELCPPALAHLLKRGRMAAGMDAHGLLADAFGLAPLEERPFAPLLASKAGLEVGTGYWLCCDPMHLEAGMSGLILHRFGEAAPDAEEIAALGERVADEAASVWPGARLYIPPGPRWFLRLESAPELRTLSPERVFHQGVAACLPQGADASALVRLMSDIQMALHSHPVNLAREERGQLPINSVWFWGGGVWQPPGPGPDRVLAESGLAAELADAARLQPFPPLLPTLSDRVLASAPADWGLLEAGWFPALASRLRWGRLQRVRLAFLDACVELAPWDMWRPR